MSNWSEKQTGKSAAYMAGYSEALQGKGDFGRRAWPVPQRAEYYRGRRDGLNVVLQRRKS